jgi:hypothetical protein
MRWCKAHKLKIRQWFGEAPRSSGAPSDPRFSVFFRWTASWENRIRSQKPVWLNEIYDVYDESDQSELVPLTCQRIRHFHRFKYLQIELTGRHCGHCNQEPKHMPQLFQLRKTCHNVNQCHNHSFFRNMQELYCWILCSIFVQSNLRKSNCQVEPVKHSGT